MIVVGGGVLGTMHAVAARSRGLEVVHLEREPDARGASVRNFGLVWVSGRAGGPELDLALRARQLWADLAAEVPGVGFRPHGSLTLAAGDAEMSLIKEAAALPTPPNAASSCWTRPRPARSTRLCAGSSPGRCCAPGTPSSSRAPCPRRCAPTCSPPAATAGCRAARPSRSQPYAVRDHTGEWHRADLVVICSGAAYTGIAGPYLAACPAPPLRRVRLQMMQTRPFAGRVATAVADGDSMRYYPAFGLPGRGLLGPQAPAAARTRAQLLLVQRLDGSLTIGDTHEYDEPFGFDVDEDAYDHLRDRAQQLLGTPLPPVQRRWAGVYSQVTGDELYHRSQIEPGVVLVTGPGGRGMTCSPAIAEETFA